MICIIDVAEEKSDSKLCDHGDATGELGLGLNVMEVKTSDDDGRRMIKCCSADGKTTDIEFETAMKMKYFEHEIAASLAREIWDDLEPLSVNIKHARSDNMIDSMVFENVISWIIEARLKLLDFAIQCLKATQSVCINRKLAAACIACQEKLYLNLCDYLHYTRVEDIAPMKNVPDMQNDQCYLQIFNVTTTRMPNLVDALFIRFIKEGIVSGYIREKETQENSSFVILMELGGWQCDHKSVHVAETTDETTGSNSILLETRLFVKNIIC